MSQLYDLLVEAELPQYFASLTSTLSLGSVAQMKQSSDEDLASIGMTRPEIRRLKKFLKKHGQHGPLTKLKRILSKGPEELKSTATGGNSAPGTGNRSSGGADCVQATLLKRSAVTVSQRLGAGEFGTVHCGTWKADDGNKMQVSLKVIKQAVTKSLSERFLDRMSSIQRLNHPHLVKLYGVIVDSQETIVVSELAPMRSLVDCLRDPGNRTLFPVPSLCHLAVQIADGMNYLELNGFLHRDLAARNVLVISKDLVKISDHGLTEALNIGFDYYQMNISTSHKLPIAWCAPECIEDGLFTSASDVWSYGVTLWEMFSYGAQPWVGFTGTQIASAIGEVKGQRLDQPERCPKEFYDLMLTCWKRRLERPKFAQILEKVQLMKVSRRIVNRVCSVTRPDCLPYNVGDIITLLDKRSPIPGFWKGIHEASSKTGLFDSDDTLPFEESDNSEVQLRKVKVKESDRKSVRPGQRLHVGMISGPQNDLRHVGHVGYDGVTFGDVVCVDIPQDGPSAMSLPLGETLLPPASVHSNIIRRSCSSSSVVSDVTSVVTSFISSDTLTDVSSMQEDFDSLPMSNSDDDLDSLQLDGSNDDLREFRIPDISSTFDLGPSLMDEVMRAIGNSKNDRPSNKVKMKTDDVDDDDDDVENRLDECNPSPLNFIVDDKKTRPLVLSPETASHLSYINGGCLGGKEPRSVAHQKMEMLEIADAFEMNETESDLSKKPNHCRNLDPEINQSIAYLNHESQKQDQFADHDVPKSDARIACRPPIEVERIRQNQDPGDDFPSSSLLGSRLSDSHSFLKNGILSKIGNALGRRGSTDQKMLHSLDTLADPNSSVCSSSESIFGARKFSVAGSSSLPTHKGGFDSMNSSGLVTDDEGGTSGVIRRTKERIRSSVASVISRRSSLKNPRFPPQQNLNANALFFDRLREQEIENAEIESRGSPQNGETRSEEGFPSAIDDGGYINCAAAGVKNTATDKTSDSSKEFISFEYSDALSDTLNADSDHLCSKKQGQAIMRR